MGFLKKIIPKEIRPGTSGATTALGIGSLFVPELGALALGNALLQEWQPQFVREQIDRYAKPVLKPVTPTAPTMPEVSTPSPTQSFAPYTANFSQPAGGIPMRLLMPPGGFEGAAQQSVAVRAGLAKAAGRKGGKRSATKHRKKNGAVKSARGRRRTSAKRSGGKMRKGSAAAKAWGAKMKRMRKKR